MKKRFHVTYGIVTPESAEVGDYAEHGFLDSHGFHDSIDRVGDSAEYAMTLREAVNLVGCCGDSGSWFDEFDSRMDYQTGAEESRSIHPPRNITPSSYGRLAALLTKGI